MSNASIDQLRKLAELNLCEKCQVVYKQLIEPGIKSFQEDYLKAWKNVELYTSLMVLKTEGAFKTRLYVWNIDEQDLAKYSDRIYVDIYKKTIKKYWSLKSRIDYLHEKGVLQEYSYKLLDLLREKRNKIHDWETHFSDQDLNQFAWGYSIVYQIFVIISDNLEKTLIDRMRNNVEDCAKQLLQIVKEYN